MIDRKPVTKALLAELESQAAPYAFQAQKKLQLFWRPTPFGKCIFHLGIIPHGRDDIDVTVDISVRFDLVETLLSEAKTDFSRSNSPWLATIGVDIGNIKDGKQKRWTIAADSQISEVAKFIMDEVRVVGFPFFERYSNLGALMQVLTRADPAYRDIAAFHVDRSYKAAILAHIIADPAEASVVSEECAEVLKDKDPEAVAAFNQFVEQLRAKQAKGLLPQLAA